jgi:hypothetical protein
VEPVHDIENIKRVTLMDLVKKRRQSRYEVKKGLNLTEDDTVESVVGRRSRGDFSKKKTLNCKLTSGCLRLIRYFLTNVKR